MNEIRLHTYLSLSVYLQMFVSFAFNQQQKNSRACGDQHYSTPHAMA
jgi:hypothetical protein